jgi:alanyl-tRNA synthetase
MTSQELRRRFLTFFKNRQHAIIPSAPLVPENDPTVLFNTAGMQPLVPFLMGDPHPAGDKLANVQKCVRTVDIDDIGDNTHATFFEMLGNWSLGSYFKEEAIKWSFDFLTSKEEGLGLDPARLYITVFEGDENAPRDEESAAIWQKVGIPKNRIYYKGTDANWWPAVKGKDTWTGPTGPNTEMFYDLTGTVGDLETVADFDRADSEQKIVEVWNDVFMEFEKKEGAIVGKLAKKNVDTGAGLERLAMVIQGVQSIFETDLFAPIISGIKNLSGKVQTAGDKSNDDNRATRIIADHIRTSVFLIADGVLPSNTDRGYVLRRLLRKAVRYADLIGIEPGGIAQVADLVPPVYGDAYPNISTEIEQIKAVITEEEQKFRKTLSAGLKEFTRLEKTGNISGIDAFTLFSTFGFPIDLTLELAKERSLAVDLDSFNEELRKHQDLSRAGATQKFKGGLADTSENSVKYHTATHLLNAALKKVLGPQVSQKGSNITSERLRFDFVHDAKMTDEQKKQVEDLVNEKIKANLPVTWEEMPLEKAREIGAVGVFGEKYGETVKVYSIGNRETGEFFSQEICGGPHVEHTGVLGHFKIAKEEAVSAGVRRIKATLE